MDIYDITQELFSGKVFAGDTKPTFDNVLKMSGGDVCNLSDLNMCVHNATHIDAPYHFVNDGKSVDEIDLSRCFGEALVVTLEKIITKDIVEKLVLDYNPKRLIIRGESIITLEGAKAIVESGILLIGIETQSVGSDDSLQEVHTKLLENDVVILEGIVLDGVPDGKYTLSALPLKLGGLDGSPCRAILIKNGTAPI